MSASAVAENPPCTPSAHAGGQAVIEDFAAAALELLLPARSDLAIRSHELAGALWGSDELLECLQQRLLERRYLRLRVLVAEPRRAMVQRAQPLVELARAMPSRIELREPSEPVMPDTSELLLVDGRLALLREDPRQAPRRPVDAAELAALRQDFQLDWDAAVPAQELRDLHL